MFARSGLRKHDARLTGSDPYARARARGVTLHRSRARHPTPQIVEIENKRVDPLAYTRARGMTLRIFFRERCSQPRQENLTWTGSKGDTHRAHARVGV